MNYIKFIIGRYNNNDQKSIFLKEFLRRLSKINDELSGMNTLLGGDTHVYFDPCAKLDNGLERLKDEIDKIKMTLNLQMLIQRFENFGVND